MSNRNFIPSNKPGTHYWNQLLQELNARMIIVEYKNYKKIGIKAEDVDQFHCYMNNAMGNLAFLISNKKPDNSA